MKLRTRNKLFEAWRYCDVENKSTEFMLEYMQSIAEVDLDCVMSFIDKTTTEDRIKYAQRYPYKS